jgi:hypothetical protein
MIIRNLNLQRPAHIGWPMKANPPLQIDADAELPNPVPAHRLAIGKAFGTPIAVTQDQTNTLFYDLRTS